VMELGRMSKSEGNILIFYNIFKYFLKMAL